MRRNTLWAPGGGAVLALGWLLSTGTLRIPDRWNPWAPLVIAEPPNLLTRYKLARLSHNAESCRGVLERADIRYARLRDRDVAPGCYLHDAVRVTATSVGVGEPFALSCRSAVSLAMWER